MEVISVSVDSHFVHKMWNDHELVKMVEGGVPFHMASDQAGNVGRAYGVWDENQGIELRGRFIIDPDGVIQAMEVLTPPVGRRFAESIRQISGIPIGTRIRRQGSYPGRMGTRQGHPQAWSRFGGQGLGSVEAIHGMIIACWFT